MSENGGETDLVKENQKIKGKARYSIKDLLKQVCFLYIFLQKHVFPSLILWLFMKKSEFFLFLKHDIFTTVTNMVVSFFTEVLVFWGWKQLLSSLKVEFSCQWLSLVYIIMLSTSADKEYLIIEFLHISNFSGRGVSW